MTIPRTLAAILLASLAVPALPALVGCGSASADDAGPDASALASLRGAWADDPVWHDGQAEVARYQATRSIYGQPRRYTATIYTNKERLDLDTTTKSATGQGPIVFKHHARDESIPTPNYRYDFSTMAYVDAETLEPWKLEMGSQEDCGTTFKRYWVEDGEIDVLQSSYFPGEGMVEATHDAEGPVMFQDALSLVLRGYRFDDPPGEPMRVNLIVDQTHNHLSESRPSPYDVTYAGRETLELPIGTVEAHRLKVTPRERRAPPAGGGEMAYWFAADASPPMLGVMVKYRGPFGAEYELKSHGRDAYWSF
jgi:hypothetical protein